MFHYTKPVSPCPRCHRGITQLRPPAVVRSHPQSKSLLPLIAQQLPRHEMVRDLSFKRRYLSRSGGGWVEVRSFFPDHSKFKLRSYGSAYRAYAVTNKNKLFGAGLALLNTAQFCFGIFSIFWIAFRPRKFLNRLSIQTRVDLHQPLVQPLPDIDLDAFKFCVYGRWKPGELIYFNLAIAFGAPSPSILHHDFT